MTERAQLHLVDTAGVEVTPAIQNSIEVAFRWVSKEFPTVDKAQLSNWAETVARSMQERGSAIVSPDRYAYVALKGKVRDWLKTATAREESSGTRRDMERIGGSNGSFQGTVDRKILFEQLENALEVRERVILLLLRNDKSAKEVAIELQTSAPAARKAIQRLKERMGALLRGAPQRKDGGRDAQSSINQRGLTVE
jgi:DNA-binding CsgD family transcriptional regulator